MTKYFHVTATMLGEGTIVLPGNYGRNLRAYSTGPNGELGNFYALARELIFEKVREGSFPDKVSRFEACFLFESEEAVLRYGHLINSTGVIYEATIVNRGAKIHRGDFSLFQSYTLKSQASFMALYENQAAVYWGNEPQMRMNENGTLQILQDVESAEILTDSPIRLERQIGFV